MEMESDLNLTRTQLFHGSHLQTESGRESATTNEQRREEENKDPKK